MAETSKIAKMAEFVSKEIFETFGWTQFGPRDANWECVIEQHGCKTHPSDVVYFYDDPYESTRIYVNADLKSYAKKTINPARLAGAISSLAKTTECANVSPGWSSLYSPQTGNWTAVGCLLVYNHDGEYDSDFQKLLDGVHPANFGIAAPRRMFLLGPQDAVYLLTVAHDIVWLRGKGDLPAPELCHFYYPDLVKVKARSSSPSAASIETLMGPWLILRYRKGAATVVEEGTIAYYRGPADSPDEWKYFLDYLFRYQLVADSTLIRVRVPFASKNAAAHFDRAKQDYVENAHPRDKEQFEARLKSVQFESVTNMTPVFSEVELGMD
jgi:hypothetical protein